MLQKVFISLKIMKILDFLKEYKTEHYSIYQYIQGACMHAQFPGIITFISIDNNNTDLSHQNRSLHHLYSL